MASKEEIINSLKKQGFNPSALDYAFMVACVSKKMREDGKSLDDAVDACYRDLK